MSDIDHDPQSALTPGPAEQSASTGDEVLSMISEMEGRLEKLRAAKAAEQRRADHLADRQQQLEARQAELRAQEEQTRARTEELERRERELRDQREQTIAREQAITEAQEMLSRERAAFEQDERSAEAVQARLDSCLAELAAARNECESLQQARDAQAQELKGTRDQLESAERRHHELTEALACVQAERDESSRAAAELRQRFDDAQNQVNSLQEAAHQAGERINALEEELEAARSTIDETEQRAATLQHELATVRAQLEEDAESFEHRMSELTEARDSALAHVAEVDGELTTLRAASEAYQNQRSQLEHDLAEARERLEQEQQRIADARREIEQQLAARESELGEAQAQLEEQLDALDQLRGEHQQLREAHDRTTTQLEQATTRADETEQELGVMREELRQRDSTLQELTSRADEAEAQASDVRAEVESLREQLETLSTERDQLAATAEQAQATAEHQNEQLSAAKAKLGEFAALIEEQADAADQVVALAQDLEASEQTIESLRSELATVGSDRDGQVQALAEKLETAERDLTAARSELEQSQERVSELIRAIEEREAVIEEMQQAGPSAEGGDMQRTLEESRAQVQALRTRLEAAEQALASKSGDGGLNEQLLERQLDERDAEIEDLRRQCQQYAARADELAAAGDGEAAALRERVRELEAEVNRPARIDVDNAPAEVAAQASRVNEAVEWAETRRRRLKLQQALLSERSEKLLQVQSVLGERHAQYEKLLGQRGVLDEARWQLQSAEKKLIKRWAKSKGAVLGMTFGILLGVLAAASFFTAEQVAPATYRAGATLQPETRGGGIVPPDARDAWGDAIQKMVTSKQVLKAAADRMGQRGYIELDEPEELAPYLKDNLSVAVDARGDLRVELLSPNRYPADRLLDTYIVALIQVANGTRDHRSDDLGTKLLNSPAVDAAPVTDERLLYAGTIFGGLLTVSGLACLFVVRSYARAKPLFDPENGTLDGLDESEWPDMSN